MTEPVTPHNGVCDLPPRMTVRDLILTAVRHLEPECARTKSLNDVAAIVKGWSLEKRRDVRGLVKAKLDNEYLPKTDRNA